MEFKAFKEAVVKAAAELGIKEYELYYSASEGTSVDTFKDEINEFSSSVNGGACFRCIVDGKMGYASTEELSDEQAVSVVKRAADNARVLENNDKQFLVSGGEEYEPLELKPYPLPTTEEMIKTALEGQKALYAADPAVIDGTSTGVQIAKEVTNIFNSNGLDLSYENSMAVFFAAPVVTDGSEMSNEYDFKIGDISKLDLKDVAEKIVKEAKDMLGADVAPTGSYPVVFSPKAMTSLMGVYSGIFNSENAQKGLSRLLGKEGEKIAADIVTIVDDPFYKDSSMPINFDAEGSPTHCKSVVENGVLKTLLYNLKTAHIAGVKTTGNASKAGYSSSVGIRPFTFYIAPGDVSEEELLKKAGSGVYITGLGGLHAGANAITGDFSLQSSGFMIEDGKKTKAVKSFTVSGNFYSLLNQITALSNEVVLPRPFGITSFGSPTVLVEGLTVAGK